MRQTQKKVAKLNRKAEKQIYQFSRGGMVLCKKSFRSKIDKSVFPGLQGGPHMNAVAAIAITLLKAQTEEFKQYAKQVLINSKTLANALMDKQVSLITGGTDFIRNFLEFSVINISGVGRITT